MLSRDIKKRLASLNRAPVAEAPEALDAPREAPVSRDGRTVIRVPQYAYSPVGETARIEEVAPGHLVERAEGGCYWLIERRLAEIAPECETFVRRYRDLLACEAILLPERLRDDLVAFAECPCERILYLDIETTGLTGMRPLFLVGVMFFDGQDFLIRQYFARHFAEEAHLLADLGESMPNFEMLVTFNGRRFDAPYIADRGKINGVELGWPGRHFDLLYESRRRWSGLLPNCRLVTLEEYLCNRRREDDIPSAMIPAAYHEFVHTEDASMMGHVIHHNALDLLTMAELALFMLVGKKDWE